MVLLEKGFSYHRGRRISDLELCNLVGLETYKALYELFPHLWIEVTYPMKACEDHLHKIKVILSLYDNISGKEIKKLLIIRYINGKCQGNCEIIAGLVGSSERMHLPDMHPVTNAVWIIWMFLMIVLIVIVVYYFVWPDLHRYYAIDNCFLIV